MITLGYVPAELTVSLSVDTDFVAKLAANPPWPVESAVSLQFLSGGTITHTWAATMVDGDAVWDVPRATVLGLINSTSRESRLVETTEAGASQVRAKGSVKIN